MLFCEVSWVLHVGVGRYLGGAWEENLSLLVDGGLVITSLTLLIVGIQVVLFKKRIRT